MDNSKNDTYYIQRIEQDLKFSELLAMISKS